MKRFDFIMKWTLKAIGVFVIALFVGCMIAGSYERAIELSVIKNEPVSMYGVICPTIIYLILFAVGGYIFGKANAIHYIKENFKKDFNKTFSKDEAV